MTIIRLWQLGKLGNTVVSLSQMASLDGITRQLPGGLYTTFRTYDGGKRVIGLKEHLRRLYGPAVGLGIQPALEEGAVRLQITRLLQPGTEWRVRLVLSEAGDIYLATEPILPLAAEVYALGVAAITLQGHRSVPSLKSTGFIEASQAERERVRAATAFEGLLVWNGRILEGLTSNFFYTRGQRVGTAKSGVLPGVTRQTIIHILHEMELPLIFRALRLEEISQVDEAFITSSSRGVVPVVEIDGKRIGMGKVGPLTRQLISLYGAEAERQAEFIV